MLPDPIKFSAASGVASLIDFAVTDLAPGKTTRINTDAGVSSGGVTPSVLTISHSESKENGAIPTTRSLIRLDVDFPGFNLVGEDNVFSGERATAAVYMVVVHPKVAGLTPAVMAAIAKGFVSGLFASGTEATYDTIRAALSSTYLERILAGEP